MPNSTTNFLAKLLLSLFLGFGVILACYTFFSTSISNPNLVVGAFVDRLAVPFSTLHQRQGRFEEAQGHGRSHALSQLLPLRQCLLLRTADEPAYNFEVAALNGIICLFCD